MPTKTPSLTPGPFPLPPGMGWVGFKHKAFLAAGVLVKGSRTTQAGILFEVGPYYKMGNGDLQITDLGAGPLISGAIGLSLH